VHTVAAQRASGQRRPWEHQAVAAGRSDAKEASAAALRAARALAHRAGTQTETPM
jgi:hypothetical protein